MSEKVTVALDWTPNTNHTGFYVAKAKGWYKEKGLDVQLLSPHEDGYTRTPASRVADESAQFAISPSETVISYHLQPEGSAKPTVKAVAAVLQDDASAVVTLADSGLDRPSKLDGKGYASYGARFEGRIVQELIRRDGGKGEYEELTPPHLGIWNTLLQGKADATWVFMGWEGVEAQQKGVALNAFKLSDYGIPYGYSPVLLASEAFISERAETLRTFLEATAKGFEFAASQPGEAAQLFLELAAAENPGLPTPLAPEMVKASQEVVSKNYLDASGRWGVQQQSRWDAFLDWLSEAGLLTTKIQSRGDPSATTATLDGLRSGDVGDQIPRSAISAAALFSNDYLPSQ